MSNGCDDRSKSSKLFGIHAHLLVSDIPEVKYVNESLEDLVFTE